MINRILFSLCVGGMGLLLFSNNLCFSQDVTVTNVSYSMKDSNVVVHYDLAGPTDKSYKIQLVLRRGTRAFFRMYPKTVEGDVGTGAFAGTGREIVWHLYEDVPYGLDGNDYYFEVDAALLGVEKGGGASWLYYVGGALIAGGAAVYFGTDLFKKAGGESQFPTPPSRP